MSMNPKNPFENFLNQQSEEAWSATLATLLRSIHEVDRNATQIWFAFYPLSLWRALEAAADRAKLVQELLLQGDYELKNQIDTSHHFLYGHRFWPQVKRAVEHLESEDASDLKLVQELLLQRDYELKNQIDTSHHFLYGHRFWPQVKRAVEHLESEDASGKLADKILAVARGIAKDLKKDESLLVGITAVAFMTVQQAGLDAFKAAPGTITIDKKHAQKSPEQVLHDRARDDSQGMLGFLKTVNKQWTVTWDENDNRAKYKLREGQDIAWGAAEDQTRDWRSIDPRRIEGPIPVECRSASCGTCWVGMLGGAEKLSDVAALEGKKIKEFGYIDTAEPKPLIRLACQAQPQD